MYISGYRFIYFYPPYLYYECADVPIVFNVPTHAFMQSLCGNVKMAYMRGLPTDRDRVKRLRVYLCDKDVQKKGDWCQRRKYYKWSTMEKAFREGVWESERENERSIKRSNVWSLLGTNEQIKRDKEGIKNEKSI